MAAGKYVCHVRQGLKPGRSLLQGNREGNPQMLPFDGPEFPDPTGKLTEAIYFLLVRDAKTIGLYFQGRLRDLAKERAGAFREQFVDDDDKREEGAALLHEADDIITSFKAGLTATHAARLAEIAASKR